VDGCANRDGGTRIDLSARPRSIISGANKHFRRFKGNGPASRQVLQPPELEARLEHLDRLSEPPARAAIATHR
jgi:hypothetical protein